MTEAVDPASENARLREELDLSRRELAAARVRLEEALEELAIERARPHAAGAADRPDVLSRIAGRLRRQAQ